MKNTSDVMHLHPDGLEFYKEVFTNMNEETFLNFRKQNSTPKSLKIKSSKKVFYISSTELQIIFRDEDGWIRFYKKFPGSPGIITLSKIGFNKSRTQAMVYIGNQKGWLEGVGYLVFLEKIGGKWKLIKLHELWVS